jgi:RNA polymerase sigma factor (sigma-70 family)
MTPRSDFPGLIARVQRQDQDAATALVKLLWPALHAGVRHRLNRWGFAQVLDPEDICQGVFAEFFERVRQGKVALDAPASAARFLNAIARNRILDEIRKVLTARRGGANRAATNADVCLDAVPSNSGTPSAAVSSDELIRLVYERLAPDERVLAVRRSQGDDWQQIADQLGGTPEAMRKKLTRAFERVLEDLNGPPRKPGPRPPTRP